MKFPSPHTIETKRLRLRQPCLEDAQPVYDGYATDPEVVRYLSWQAHSSVDVTHSFLALMVDNWKHERGHRAWIIERRSDRAVLGMIGVDVASTGAVFGYVLARPFWGHGYVAEALTRLVEDALADPTIYRAWAFCDVDNVGSARVMEKAGMQFEGTLRRYGAHSNVSSEPRDIHVYARVR